MTLYSNMTLRDDMTLSTTGEIIISIANLVEAYPSTPTQELLTNDFSTTRLA